MSEVSARLAKGEEEWREQMDLKPEAAGARVLVCACTPLPGDEHAENEAERQGGFVIVFDDISALLQAQRDAAWGEVARRLAHEIKNPLTPIQLSAERMRRRYLEQMTGEDAQILDRATYTIVQQVEAMKAMVNAFSEYARAPDMKVTRFPLNALVTEVADLHRVQESGVQIDVDLDPRIDQVEADRGRVRQILNNLIVNGAEAVENTPNGRVIAATRLESVGIGGLRDHHRDRQRTRIRARGARPRLRPLRHEQAEGHRPGPRDRQEDRRGARRARRGRQSAGRRRAGACILATD